MTTKTQQTAIDRGASDFLAGSHLNPYSWSKEGDKFRAWIIGYNAAKATQTTPLGAAQQQTMKTDDSAAWRAVPKVNTNHK